MNESYFIPILISGGILFLIFLFFINFYMFMHKRRLHLHFVEREKMKYDYNLNLMAARLEEQERAMGQISREIHDNVAQNIDVLQMNIQGLQDDPSNAMALSNCFSLVELIGNDLRNISYSLNGDYVTAHGLGPVIKKELDYISSSRSMACELELKGKPQTLLPEQELLLYRIVQEAIHNSIKHSNAKKLVVSIKYNPENLWMQVADNGRGFDKSSSRYMEGLGFKSMEHRANLLGTKVSVEATPGAGCAVSLNLDYNSKAPQIQR